MADKNQEEKVWKEIEERLRFSGYALLLCDSDEVTLRVIAHADNWLQMAIYVFVNGKFGSKEGERYSMTRFKYAYTDESRRKAKKMSKKRLKDLGLNPDKKYHFHEPRWTSFQSMKRHFCKVCNHVHLEGPDATK